jgi:hypothetical protein
MTDIKEKIDEQINEKEIIHFGEPIIEKLTFNKPKFWDKMLMFQKIKYYASIIDEKYMPYIDKLEVKESVKLLNDKVKTAKVIRVLDNCDDIHLEDLNTKWMIKATHGCGWNININESLLNNPDKNEILKLIKNKLKTWNTYYETPNEKHYKYLTPRFFIEEKVIEKDGSITGNADNYMIRCIHGVPYTIGYKRGNKQNYYDINWIPMMKGQLPDLPKPSNLDEIIDLAKDLSKPFEFVRIDVYDCLDGIYLSEFTFTPSGGNKVFTTEIEKYYGQFWN